MTPHEFLKYTPGSNCGACGYPACLAFAVAVTKSGVRAGLCPYLDKKELPPEFAAVQDDPGNAADIPEKRDMTLAAHLKAKIHELDFSSLAQTLNADWSADHPTLLKFLYLGRMVELGLDLNPPQRLAGRRGLAATRARAPAGRGPDRGPLVGTCPDPARPPSAAHHGSQEAGPLPGARRVADPADARSPRAGCRDRQLQRRIPLRHDRPPPQPDFR